MLRTLLSASVCFGLLFVSGCSRQSQDQAREDMQKVTAKVEHDSKELGHNIDKAVGTDSRSASDKLADGKAKLEAAGSRASTKLSQASLIAQVKTNLASDAGLSSITDIEVEANGSVVTLRGHVSTEAQKDAADHAAAKVDGVTRVENEIRVTK